MTAVVEYHFRDRYNSNEVERKLLCFEWQADKMAQFGGSFLLLRLGEQLLLLPFLDSHNIH